MKFRARIDQASVQRVKEKLQDLRSPLTKKDAEQIGKAVVQEMKVMIAKTQSPIAGDGKFPALKPNYRKWKQGQGEPGIPNLKLTGKFLADLGHKAFTQSGRWVLSVGFTKQSERVKERGHREGVNGQRKRPIIPQDGEKFARQIQQRILEIAIVAVKRVTRRK